MEMKVLERNLRTTVSRLDRMIITCYSNTSSSLHPSARNAAGQRGSLFLHQQPLEAPDRMEGRGVGDGG